MSCLKSQEMRTLAPELDPLRIGTGWKPEDLSKPQILIESTYGDSHPGSGHLNVLVEEVRKGVAEAGGFGARYGENGEEEFLHLEQDIIVPISVMEKVREQTELTSLLQVVK